MTSSAAQGSWRVLVVDDEENLNWSLVNSLRKEGYTVDGALTGLEAQSRLSQAHYDCVISDVKMPGMDGFELLQWLRQHQPQTRVIMMTAFASPTTQHDALSGGVIAYFEKPFDLRTLKDELRRMSSDTRGPVERETYDLIEVVRVVSLSRRDMVLRVEAGPYSGRLCFQRGELVWAESGQLRGDEAFLQLCAPHSCRVQQEPWDELVERNVAQPISQLIFSALVRRDPRPPAGASLPYVRPTAPVTAPLPPSSMVPTGGPPPVTLSGSGAVRNTGVPRGSTLEMAQTPAMPLRPAAAESTGMTGDMASVTGTGPLRRTTMPPEPQVTDASSPVGMALDEALATLPHPAGIVLLRPDASDTLAQRWVGRAPLATSAYTHLATAVQAAARALLLADLGMMDEVWLATTDHVLLLVRSTQMDRPGLVMAVLPVEADRTQVTGTLRAAAPVLFDALR